MRMKIFSIVLVALLREPCFTGATSETPKDRKFVSHLVDITVQVLTSCYGQRVNVIGIHGDSTGFLLEALLSRQILPVISIENTTKLDHCPKWGKSRYKLQLFTIVASSTVELQEILKKIKNSLWWNHMASFMILDWTTSSDHSCLNAYNFLWIAWQMDILNVNYFCNCQTPVVLIYTFNPFTQKAPSAWKLKDTFKGKHGHTWSMFMQKTHGAKDVCEGLDFDKTTDVGGYRIPASVQDEDIFWILNRNKTGLDSLGGLDGILVETLFRAINADVELTIYSEDEEYIGWNQQGEITGFVLDVVGETNDMVLNAYHHERLMNLTTTYPHWQGGLGVVTQYSGHLSQLSKINSVIDVSSRYGLYLVILITIIFFKFFLRQTLTTAFLNTLRITCNSSLPQAPTTITIRIYLGALFFFQITILALYQGQLASLLTKDVNKKNVNTIQDLVDFGHTIHGHEKLAPYFNDPVFTGGFIGHKSGDCAIYVLHNRSAACAIDWDLITSKETHPALHLSSGTIIPTPYVYAIRENWPLEPKVNEILARMIEGDIIRRTYTTYSEKILSINRYKTKIRYNQGPKVLTSLQLSFAFAILGIGLGCATVAMIVEIILGRAH